MIRPRVPTREPAKRDEVNRARWRRRVGAVVLAMAACLSGGCSFRMTTRDERKASFEPHAHLRVNNHSIRRHLVERSAVVMVADQAKLDDRAHPETFEAMKVSGPPDFGTAAAIDARGYFLTAAHCVARSDPFLLFYNQGRLRLERARVVWRSSTKADLALLHVPMRVHRVFEWATDYRKGDLIFAVGPDFETEPFEITATCFAGEILESKDQDEKHRISTISHDAPVHRGDSGGPLATVNGQLIGINVLLRYELRFGRRQLEPARTVAHRPDLDMLRQIIEQDVAQLSKPPA